MGLQTIPKNYAGKKQYHYISLPVNLGLTGAMQTGMKYAKEKNYDMGNSV